MNRIAIWISASLLAGWPADPAREATLKFAPAAGSSLQKHFQLEVQARVVSLTFDGRESTADFEPLRLITSARFQDTYELVAAGRPLAYLRQFDALSGRWEYGARRTEIPGFESWDGAELSFAWDEARQEYARELERGRARLPIHLETVVEDLDMRGFLPGDSVAIGEEWTIHGRPVLDAMFGTTELGFIATPQDRSWESRLRDFLMQPLREYGEEEFELTCRLDSFVGSEGAHLAKIALRLRGQGTIVLPDELENDPLTESLIVDCEVDGNGELWWNVDEGRFSSMVLLTTFRLTIDAGAGHGICEGTAKWNISAELNRLKRVPVATPIR